MSDASRVSGRASRLRLEFDRSFAEEVRGDPVQTDDLLTLRLGSAPYALRLSEVAGLYVDRVVTRTPGGGAGLLGFAAFRGAIAAVYDLHLLLGLPPARTARWLAMAQAIPVAFAFETFEGRLRVPREATMAQGRGEQPHPLIRGFASFDGLARPIVHLPSVLDAIGTARPKPNAQTE